MERMNIYHVSGYEKYLGYDSYDSFVIVCKTEEIARNTHPSNGEYKWWNNEMYDRQCNSWVKEEDVPNLTVTHVGVANENTEDGLVCSSFNAG